jgi:3-phenylpropionate/cinnamic acid dioxygenase small subunit
VLSLQEISDRMEISDLLARYSAAIDSHRWNDLDELFTEDAVIDYTEMGGIRGTLAEQKAFLASVMPGFAGFQHLTATSTFDIDGDVARVRTICFNPMVITDEQQVFFCGLWYRDVMVRTPAGWRIRERHEDRGWSLDVRA